MARTEPFGTPEETEILSAFITLNYHSLFSIIHKFFNPFSKSVFSDAIVVKFHKKFFMANFI